MSKKAGWVIAVLGVVGASVVIGIVGAVVFRFGWTEPQGIEFAREAMQSFEHDSGYAHGEEDPLPHFFKHGSRVAAGLHRHCLVHDVNGDGDTADFGDNDGTCPGPDTGLPDLPWHQPLPDPGDSARASALKWGVILGAFSALWTATLVAPAFLQTLRADRQARATEEADASESADQTAIAHSEDPRTQTPTPTKRSVWVIVVLCAIGISLAAGMAGLSVSQGRWTDSENRELASEFIRSFDHSSNFPHGEEDQFWHIYMGDDGRVDAEWHRHCPTHDVNGDGDTADHEDNDGTCPGPDTALPDLPWHPPLPNSRFPAWGDRVKEAVFLAAATAIALTAILAAVGIPWAARRNRKSKAKEAVSAKGLPTTQTN